MVPSTAAHRHPPSTTAHCDPPSTAAHCDPLSTAAHRHLPPNTRHFPLSHSESCKLLKSPHLLVVRLVSGRLERVSEQSLWRMLWTLDKVVRVMFWGGVSALLATLLSALGVVSCLLAFITLWLLTAASYLYTADMKLPVSGKSVVVTGCDTGFGNTLALHLDKLVSGTLS
ncbi:putative D-beta-hydroxybutyrate dehydrogenase-like 7 [Homarus americanus]|uniref:Putative D-beta-hydroxybutyrate dehydrogenase-like 7 n=1 Tax=Homarus americanus TaxID=6706 RepID=A0A8J5K6A4_HOMAM|nr:putative D-beta-hydroxybutyrate dehydrogenase-like 7 [Homarus americanus]